ncbi:putative 2-succinylbenzoate--CoA ligase [Mycobacterium talmoniae]|uniref:Putative 2-succinylbenzoate--CoA ligase n=1 Tax=Mycobacterium talmoniae TaxID=1858794 RepID=A0A2S8BBV0_9MYCO|nr:putative 2-succinylbenzoate--CoA ligase [Mycobacterium talmoniae]
MRTTDLARIDADGFLWILGRADQAIIRGGFKVMPDDVRLALEAHPAVQGAAVVGRPDPRLRADPGGHRSSCAKAPPPTRRSWSTSSGLGWPATEIPTDIAVVEAIPRTPSGKADLGAIRRYFTAQGEYAR